HLLRRHSQAVQGGAEETLRRLPDQPRLPARRILQRGDERTSVENQLVPHLPVTVLLQSQYLGASQNGLKGAIEGLVIEAGSQIAHYHHLRIPLHDRKTIEFLAGVLLDEKHAAGRGPAFQLSGGHEGGVDHLILPHLDPEASQASCQRSPAPGGGVGGEAERYLPLLEPADGIDGIGDDLFVVIDDPINVDKESLDLALTHPRFPPARFPRSLREAREGDGPCPRSPGTPTRDPIRPEWLLPPGAAPCAPKG